MIKSYAIIFSIVMFSVMFSAIPKSFSQTPVIQDCEDVISVDEMKSVTRMHDYDIKIREIPNAGERSTGMLKMCSMSMTPEIQDDPDLSNQILGISINFMEFDSLENAKRHHDMIIDNSKELDVEFYEGDMNGWNIRDFGLYDDQRGVPGGADHMVAIEYQKENYLAVLSMPVKGDKSLANNEVLQMLFIDMDENLMALDNNLTNVSVSENYPVPGETKSGEKEGGGCLIATAAYGSELAPQVQFLREIRDNTVMSTSSGTAFMTGFNQLYYSFSPTIADMERENPMFQQAIRALITPMVSTLSIMTLADTDSETEVLGLGISVIALNLGMYVAAPAAVGFTSYRYVKSRMQGKTS
jgi:hypothetical protein